MGLRDAQGLSGAAQFSGSAGWGGVVVVEVSGCLLPHLQTPLSSSAGRYSGLGIGDKHITLKLSIRLFLVQVHSLTGN